MPKASRKPPKRKTKALGAWVTLDVRQQAEDRAQTNGETLSAYVSRLITNDTASEAVKSAQIPAILGHRTVMALEALTDRIVSDASATALLEDLRAIRRDLVAALLALRVDYDRELDAANDPLWDGHH